MLGDEGSSDAVSLSGVQWDHTYKIWRDCGVGLCQVSDLPGLLLQDVPSYGLAGSHAWAGLPSCPPQLHR